MSSAVQLFERVVGKRPILKVAQEWGVPSYVLYEWRRGDNRCPRARYLPAMARGLGITVEEFIELCGINGDSPPTPPEQ